MAWVRIDDGFTQHPKVAQAGPLGIAMQIAGLCYCNRYLTDGFIPRAVVPALLNLEGIAMRVWDGELSGGGEDVTWQLVVSDLIGAGLWEEVEGGYRIHDYLDYQPSRQQVLAEREKTAERVRKHRAKEADRNDSVTPLPARYDGVSNTTPNPDPKESTQESTSGELNARWCGEGMGEPTPPPSPDATPTELAILHELKSVPGYPFDHQKDLEHVRNLMTDYPELDLLSEAKKWRTYKRDKPLKAKSNARLQFRNWCDIALQHLKRAKPRARDAPWNIDRSSEIEPPDDVQAAIDSAIPEHLLRRSADSA